ncbi:MAG: hypothetical protein N2Z85_01680 [Patescibacteria group bacterium]|nr:hypothetical protein [Patescibacteria group bacterium]
MTIIKTILLVLYAIYCVIVLTTIFYFIIKEIILSLRRKIYQLRSFIEKLKSKKKSNSSIFHFKSF